MTVTTVVVCLFGKKEELIIHLKHLWGLAEQSKTFPYDRNWFFLSLKDIHWFIWAHLYVICVCVRSFVCVYVSINLSNTYKNLLFITIRPDIFYFSSFKNPGRNFSRNGKKKFFKFRVFYCRPYENCAESLKNETNWVRNYILLCKEF